MGPKHCTMLDASHAYAMHVPTRPCISLARSLGWATLRTFYNTKPLRTQLRRTGHTPSASSSSTARTGDKRRDVADGAAALLAPSTVPSPSWLTQLRSAGAATGAVRPAPDTCTWRDQAIQAPSSTPSLAWPPPSSGASARSPAVLVTSDEPPAPLLCARHLHTQQIQPHAIIASPPATAAAAAAVVGSIFDAVWPLEQSPEDFMLGSLARCMAARCAPSPKDGLLRVPLATAGAECAQQFPTLHRQRHACLACHAAWLCKVHSCELTAHHSQTDNPPHPCPLQMLGWTRCGRAGPFT